VKTLYFDIDGTVLDRCYTPKPLLAEGGFERALKAAGFERLVCVGNVILIVQALQKAGVSCDPLEKVWCACRGVFADEAWFRAHVELVPDPTLRAAYLDLDQDWWYVDDLAEHYCERAGRGELFKRHEGKRIHAADPEGDGSCVLAWLKRCGV